MSGVPARCLVNAMCVSGVEARGVRLDPCLSMDILPSLPRHCRFGDRPRPCVVGWFLVLHAECGWNSMGSPCEMVRRSSCDVPSWCVPR